MMIGPHIRLFKRRQHLFACMCMMACFYNYAQKTDTTAYNLNEVIIVENKQQQLQPSKKSDVIDSLIFTRYNTTSLADLLSNQSAIHIKTYGNGNIATISMRGGNANHTALLWNGLNIQNAMLGQPDLSIVPSSLFDNVSLEYGGGSGLWGSGAIGGSIHINNALLFDKGLKTKVQVSAGSFDTKKIAATVLLSYKRIASSTRMYNTSSQNNYKYKDTLDKENPNKQVTHADYTTKGLMQEVSFLATPSQKINLRMWYNNTFRNIPAFTSPVASKQHQEDKNLKLSGDWGYSKGRFNSIIRLAHFNDALNYMDSVAKIYSKSTVKTSIIESDNRYDYRKQSFNVGVNYTNYQSTLYSGTDKTTDTYRHYLEKVAFFVAYKIRLLKSRLNYNITIRKEFTSQTNIPFTGNTGLKYQLTRQLALKANSSSSFRQPTLNDLYWSPGGNPNLKPEESYEVEGGIEARLVKNRFSLVVEATYFNRHTKNWIIWLQTPKGYFSPKNIAEVYSRGTDTKTELTYTHQQFIAKLIVNTSYVLSTSEKAISENDNSVNRQLVYTPRYTGQATLLLNYKNLNVLFNQNYTGYRFTSTDNTSWLNPYYIANVKAAYHYSFKSVMIELFGSINNLFNKNYMVVVSKPMPLRNYEAGITLQYNKKNKSNTNP